MRRESGWYRPAALMLCFVWESEAWRARSCNPGCQSRVWNIVPSGPWGPAHGSRALLGPGRGTANQLPSSSQGWFLGKLGWQQLHRQLLSCFCGKTRSTADSAPKQRQRCQLRAGWGMTSASEKSGFWIASHFAKYQVCPSERCLTQATQWRVWVVLVPSVLKSLC